MLVHFSNLETSKEATTIKINAGTSLNIKITLITVITAFRKLSLRFVEREKHFPATDYSGKLKTTTQLI